MPAFSGRFDWDAGLIWQVGFVTGKAPPDTDVVSVYSALVDTGASRTCIAQSLAEEIDARPIGKTAMQTAGGSVSANIYDVHVGIVLGNAKNPDGSGRSQVSVIPNVRVLEFEPGHTTYSALIGRDILRDGVLTLSFDGHFSYSF